MILVVFILLMYSFIHPKVETKYVNVPCEHILTFDMSDDTNVDRYSVKSERNKYVVFDNNTGKYLFSISVK